MGQVKKEEDKANDNHLQRHNTKSLRRILGSLHLMKREYHTTENQTQKCPQHQLSVHLQIES